MAQEAKNPVILGKFPVKNLIFQLSSSSQIRKILIKSLYFYQVKLNYEIKL